MTLIICKGFQSINTGWWIDFLYLPSQLPSFPNHSVSVKYAIEHRCGVRVRGPGLASTITGTDPLKDK